MKNLPTLEEVKEKIIIGNKDIQVLFGCSHSTASKIINAIHATQDSFDGMLRGKVHKADLDAYLKANRKKTRVSV